jgi:RNA polymerase sigma-70 factor (ECF subfamily)
LLARLRAEPTGSAWERFVKLYDPLLRGWLGRHGVSGVDVDDLIQDIFTVLVQKVGEFEHNGQRGAFRTWLKRITFNQLRNHWRARKRNGAMQPVLDQLVDPASDLSIEWDREHDLHVTARLLEMIQSDFQPSTWQAFRRVVFENAAPDEVARELNLQVAAVWSAKSRVLRRLRQEAAGMLE